MQPCITGAADRLLTSNARMSDSENCVLGVELTYYISLLSLNKTLHSICHFILVKFSLVVQSAFYPIPQKFHVLFPIPQKLSLLSGIEIMFHLQRHRATPSFHSVRQISPMTEYEYEYKIFIAWHLGIQWNLTHTHEIKIETKTKKKLLRSSNIHIRYCVLVE